MSPHGEPTPADRQYLMRARELARRGWGHVHPNPMVGCVLVRDGEVVAEGYHQVFGGRHAEIVALESARTRAQGSTAYVSLEPCNHQGKTPPCSHALVAAGVRRVVFGAADPGTASGGGGAALAAEGVEVSGPVWPRAFAELEDPAFFYTARHDTPFVALKLALSLDGHIASVPGARTRITGPEAEHEVHRLRSGYDALLIGSDTWRVDDPQLTVRLAPQGRVPPRRVVLDAQAELPSNAALLRDAQSVPVHVFTRADAREADMERLEAEGAHVHPVGSDAEGRLDLHAVLKVLRELGIRSILCEGGGKLGSSLLQSGHARRVYLFVAPLTLGTGGVPAFAADAETLPWDAFVPAFPPQLHGRDTLMVLDREDD